LFAQAKENNPADSLASGGALGQTYPPMLRIVFTANLRRHVDAPPAQMPGGTVRAVLDAIFAQHPRLRGYVLDEQDRVRRHVVLGVSVGGVWSTRDGGDSWESGGHGMIAAYSPTEP